MQSFNTQPPEGGCNFIHGTVANILSFNTQPPEGGCLMFLPVNGSLKSFNTQPPEGGCYPLAFLLDYCAKFQHTATRRWLRGYMSDLASRINVSTHSHPKVAARITLARNLPPVVSTHSHPKVAASLLLLHDGR